MMHDCRKRGRRSKREDELMALQKETEEYLRELAEQESDEEECRDDLGASEDMDDADGEKKEESSFASFAREHGDDTTYAALWDDIADEVASTPGASVDVETATKDKFLDYKLEEQIREHAALHEAPEATDGDILHPEATSEIMIHTCIFSRLSCFTYFMTLLFGTVISETYAFRIVYYLYFPRGRNNSKFIDNRCSSFGICLLLVVTVLLSCCHAFS